MKLKIILITMLLISNVFASDFDIKDLTPQDIQILKEIKEHGKDQGLSYSLMAIAIKESIVCKYLVNVDTKNYGMYQANIKTVISSENAKDTSWNRNVFAMKLPNDSI